MELIRPDRPSRCMWKSHAQNSPHTQRNILNNRDSVLPNILHAIGQTPMVRLNNIPQSRGIQCEIFAKCEFMNPGGSVKDRIAYRMIQDAEEKGLLKPGYTIIEPTSGNTGIGLAMASAVKGYRCIIVMPEKMSNEKISTLRALGAEIIRTPTEASWDSPESHISVSQKLQKEIPNSIILDQYVNSGNPLAHYDHTAEEIWKQCCGKIDYLIAGAGTGGTISGIGRKLKELHPEIKIIGVDPVGSILAHPAELNKHSAGFYEVEGIGYDFLPTVLDHDVVDMWIKSTDKESLNAARMLIREEGLLCGGSSGAALHASLTIAKDISADKRIVILLPDGIRNYMTKFVSDYWMEMRGFLKPQSSNDANKTWWDYPLSVLTISKFPTVTKETTCQETISILKTSKSSLNIVIGDKEKVNGIITTQALLNNLASGKVKQTDSIEKIIVREFPKITPTSTLGKLSRIFENNTSAVVVNPEDDTLVGVVEQFELLDFISSNNDKARLNGCT